MKLKAVFFDAGETLLAAHPSFAELFAIVLGESGHTVSVGAAEAVLEEGMRNSYEYLERIGSRTWSTSPEVSRRFWGMIYERAVENLGIKDASRLAGTLYDRFTKYESYRLFPDAVPTLEAVKSAGATVGLISNFEEWLESMLIEWEIAPLFDLLVISGKEGVEKPDPAIFLAALERAGVGAEESVYVGDHPRVDFEAARSVGMRGVLIDRRGRHPAFEGERVENLAELLPILGIR